MRGESRALNTFLGIAAFGCVLVGCLGVLGALGALLGGEFIASGVFLSASALAFGSLGRFLLAR